MKLIFFRINLEVMLHFCFMVVIGLFSIFLHLCFLCITTIFILTIITRFLLSALQRGVRFKGASQLRRTELNTELKAKVEGTLDDHMGGGAGGGEDSTGGGGQILSFHVHSVQFGIGGDG